MARAKFSTSPGALNAIFREAIPLFAQSGFDGVSMRHIAKAVGVSIATLYYHFPDKQTLYLRCIEEAFANKAQGLSEILAIPGTPEQQLQQFIYRFTCLMASDTHFRRLLQRELLDGDETRLRVLAKEVFQTQFQGITELAKTLAPNCDAHLMAISMVGLVLFHLETTPIRQFLPGGRAEHNESELIAKHVTQLLLKGILQCGND
ncbi:MAG: TetR/AcrR family transcriptional regulator [Gammaproteobacteria bacterium]|nr:MAG: TetR/AcrR family transcriptional regulator [Gammaproteobacteria bacterium]RKZ39957.1 MAG: TetR/AcrR family transcriptional regulator [Gammaproteobacteria bacterium]RKZ73720.1 MAG: TetR/AcrR family transcriptional regulator [Gammaproteobacteria bacterium]